MNNIVSKALQIATKAHEGQKDKAGVDYVLHPVWLALQMSNHTEQTIALLHDVLEDSDFTAEDLLEEGFEGCIVDTVVMLTRKDGEDYFKYIDRISEDYWATKVKLADLFHNSDLNRISELTEKDFQRREKYLKAIEILQEKWKGSGYFD